MFLSIRGEIPFRNHESIVSAHDHGQVSEVRLEEGTVMIPEETEEVELVVDRQPNSVRVAAAVSFALSLLVLVGVGVAERGSGG